MPSLFTHYIPLLICRKEGFNMLAIAIVILIGILCTIGGYKLLRFGIGCLIGGIAALIKN